MDQSDAGAAQLIASVQLPGGGTATKCKFGVVCSEWQSKGAVDDKNDNFSQALIIVEMPNRVLQEGKQKGPAFDNRNKSPKDFSKVKVIALDEVDKLNAPDTKDNVEEVVEKVKELATSPPQIICVSATVARGPQANNDTCLRWIQEVIFCKSKAGLHPDLRPALRLQSANFMPKSVFHLIVDLRQVAGGRPYPDREERLVLSQRLERLDEWRKGPQGRAQILWERQFSSEQAKKGAFPVGALSFCASNDSARIQAQIQNAQRDDGNRLFGGSWDCIINKDKALTRFMTLNKFRNYKLHACVVGSADMARGLDQHFNSVLISENFPKVDGSSSESECATYVQSSGRCGRTASARGVSVVFIRTDQDHKCWNDTFTLMAQRQPDLHDRVGVVKHPRDLRLGAEEPKEEQFLKAISGLPVNRFMPGETRHPHFPEFHLVWAEGKKTSGEPWIAASASGPAVPPPTITPSAVPGPADNVGDAVLMGRVLIYHGPCPTVSLTVPEVHWPN